MNEEEIVQRLKNGDKEALGDIYSLYVSSAVKTAYLITSHKQTAEDVVQEAFLNCYKYINSLKDPKLFKPWFYRLLTRLSWKYSKQYQKIFPAENVNEIIDSSGNCDEYFKDEKYSFLYEKIERLKPKLKTTIILYYFNEMSIKEISNIMGCFEGTVKSRLSSARKLLRESLEGLK